MFKKPADELAWGEFHHYFNAFVVGDVTKSLQVKIEVGTIILTTVGLECLSGYYAGEEASRQHFTRFMTDFMPRYAAFADDIYACVRNGLAHDYVIKKNPATGRSFVFQRDHGEPHLSPAPGNPQLIHLNREDYANDFLKAQAEYFERVNADQVLWDRAICRLQGQRGFLTVRPIDQFAAPSPGGPAAGPTIGASAIGLTTGTSTKPPGT